MSRRGTNPCLVCGEDTLGPKGGVVCNECRRKVADYDALRARSLDGAVSIHLRRYQYVPGRQDDNKRGQLDRLLAELRVALDSPKACRGSYSWPSEGETAPKWTGQRREKPTISEENGTAYNVDARLAQFFVDLEPMIQHALDEAAAEGKRKGSNLLAQLAAGELTTPEFEKRAGITP